MTEWWCLHFDPLDKSAKLWSVYCRLTIECNINISKTSRIDSSHEAVQVFASSSIFQARKSRKRQPMLSNKFHNWWGSWNPVAPMTHGPADIGRSRRFLPIWWASRRKFGIFPWQCSESVLECLHVPEHFPEKVLVPIAEIQSPRWIECTVVSGLL